MPFEEGTESWAVLQGGGNDRLVPAPLSRNAFRTADGAVDAATRMIECGHSNRLYVAHVKLRVSRKPPEPPPVEVVTLEPNPEGGSA